MKSFLPLHESYQQPSCAYRPSDSAINICRPQITIIVDSILLSALSSATNRTIVPFVLIHGSDLETVPDPVYLSLLLGGGKKIIVQKIYSEW